jgi:hypothetical protein
VSLRNGLLMFRNKAPLAWLKVHLALLASERPSKIGQVEADAVVSNGK